jgi:KDO2-lipid IV(A) lauroyltransferase
MYFVSDVLYVIIFYIIGYRKAVVRKNLEIAFPEKTDEQRERIAKDFYHNFLDTMVEIIKLISIDEKEFSKRITSNVHVLNDLKGKVPNVAIICGHFFNWEIGNLAASRESAFKLLSVYMPIASKPVDKIMYNMRKKFGGILIPATDFKNHFIKYVDSEYALGLIADQNPSDSRNAYWLPFFNKLTPFVKGPENNSKRNNSAVVFVNSSKPKRGYYHMNYILVTTDANSYPEGALTKEFIRLIEQSIKNYPSNYLWSHRRFKHEFKEEEHRSLIVE